MSATWDQFRTLHPLHSQVIAYGEADSDGYRAVIIAEPPPHVTLNAVRFWLRGISTEVITEDFQIGYDGRLRDIVFSLSPACNRDSLLASLASFLYGTSLGAPIQRIDTLSPSHDGNLDIQLHPDEVLAWTVRSDEHWTHPASGLSYSAKELLSRRVSGVFLADSSELLVWSLPKKANLDKYVLECRHFAVMSDLVLGAIADEHQIMIVARKRQTSYDVLPPLRTETLMRIAASNSIELAQSYERNALFAGLVSTKASWAPIYLSDELFDTEFGSLLCITDQLLKSWSEVGAISYEDFDYPVPQKYPLKRSAWDSIGSEQLRYNWNAEGSAYVVKEGKYDVFTIRRTGALSVLYDPSGGTGGHASKRELETARALADEAYDGFSSNQDPNLLRAVQYTALYQIFKEYGISSKDRIPKRPRSRLTDPRVPLCLDAFGVAMNPSIRESQVLAKLTERQRRSVSKIRDTLDALVLEYGNEVLKVAASQAINPRDIPQSCKELAALLAEEPQIEDNPKVIEFLESLSQKELLSFDVWFRWTSGLTASDFESITDLAAIHAGASASGLSIIATSFGLAAQVRDAIMRPTDDALNSWIKTPSVVQSSNESEEHFLATGGHNLSAKPLRIVLGGGRRGTYQNLTRLGRTELTIADGDRTVMAALADNHRLGSLTLHGEVPPATNMGVRPVGEVIHPSSFPRDVNVVHLPKSGENVVHIDGSDPKGWSMLIDQTGTKHVRLSRPVLEDKIIDVAKSPLPNGKPLVLDLKGFEDVNEINALLKTMSLRLDVLGERPSLLGVFRKGSNSEGRNIALNGFDFSKSEIMLKQQEVIKDGVFTGENGISAEVTIPRRAFTGNPFHLRVKLYLESLQKGELKKVKTALTHVLKKANTSTPTLESIQLDLIKELRLVDPQFKSGSVEKVSSDIMEASFFSGILVNGRDESDNNG